MLKFVAQSWALRAVFRREHSSHSQPLVLFVFIRKIIIVPQVGQILRFSFFSRYEAQSLHQQSGGWLGCGRITGLWGIACPTSRDDCQPSISYGLARNRTRAIVVLFLPC